MFLRFEWLDKAWPKLGRYLYPASRVKFVSGRPQDSISQEEKKTPSSPPSSRRKGVIFTYYFFSTRSVYSISLGTYVVN